MKYNTIGAEELTIDFVEKAEAENPDQLFCLKNVEISSRVRELRNGDYKFEVCDGKGNAYDCMCFKAKIKPQSGKKADVIFKPVVNRWQGGEKIQLNIKEIKFDKCREDVYEE